MDKRRRMELVEHVPELPSEFIIEILSGLPSQLIVEILSRLPGKSLMLCKCICKSWYSIIRDPHFVSAYKTMHKSLNQGKLTNLFLTNYNTTTKQSRVYSIQVTHDESGIITSTPVCYKTSAIWCGLYSCAIVISGGLVCHRYKWNQGFFCIFNPSTGELVRFPLPHEANVALGFSSQTNEYKVLQSLRIRGSLSRCFQFKILTLGDADSNAWRDVPEIDYEDLGLVPKNLGFSSYYICIHGAIHWMQRTVNQHVLLAFDVEEERFRIIPLPKDYNEGQIWTCRVVEVNGCVAVFNLQWRHVRRSNIMDFWILKDYQNQVWFKDRIIFPQGWDQLGNPYPVCSLYTGELLLGPFSSDRSQYGYVHLYDMKLKTYKKTEIIFPKGSLIVGWYDETIFALEGRSSYACRV